MAAARLRVHEGHEANVAAAAALLNSSQRVLERHSSEASERSMIGAAATPFGAPPPAAAACKGAKSQAFTGITYYKQGVTMHHFAIIKYSTA